MCNHIDEKSEFIEIQTELRKFIELSLREEDDLLWADWISSISSKVNIKCWEEKKCDKKDCPAYLSTCGRCWIIAGTMCGGEVQGKFAKKYSACRKCDIYQKVVYGDPAKEIKEHLIVLIHSLRCKQQEINEMSIKDHLTGLFNKRYFDTYVAHEYSKIKRSNSSLVIMMIDINCFKIINDEFGHLKGDYVLKECADILTKSTRESDVVFRVGGDEFIIIMHACCDDVKYAESLIGRIDGNISLFNKHTESNNVLSLSYGFSILNADIDLQNCIEDADQKMYVDKKRRKEHFRDIA